MTQLMHPTAEPITEKDEFIASALESASIPALMMSIVHLTGDTSLLDGPLRPGRAVLGEGTGGMSDEDRSRVRALALEALRTYRDTSCRLPPQPSPETIHRMMSFMVGEEVPAEYVPMMLEELRLGGEDLRDVARSAAVSEEARQRFPVLVIGAGMSGLLAGIRLGEAGLPYLVVEKNDAVGGTWHENTYPGCRVDVGNHFYCFSFEPNHDWSEFYSKQDELQRYFDHCATKYGVRDHIRFRTEVVSARFVEDAGGWEVLLRGPRGEERLHVRAIISAVGQLNRPKLPEIPGLERFSGPTFHSAEWQHEHELSGKRIAVIGTGASALQLVPELGKLAAQLSVYQRSPAWMFPNPGYHRRVSEATKWLLKHVPYYARWNRFLIFWPGSDGLLPSLIVDPDWPQPDRSINQQNEGMRQVFTQYMESQVGDDPELLAKVVPSYPPFGKRMLQDNGSWLQTLARENVELVSETIERIEPDGIVTRGGGLRQHDLIVFATGFHANRFLWPMEIIGRGGVNLREHWGEDPRAYLGITMPGFPNLFCLYGPSTNLAHAGSIIFHSECQVRYVMGCLEAMLAAGAASLDCRRDVHDAYNRRLDEALEKTVWAHPGVDSWYKNAKGRVTTTSPWRLLDYWRWTREPDLTDFELTPPRRSRRTSRSG